MSRLIDADVYKKRIDRYPPEIRNIAKKELRYTPTVDAVQVVRCGECKYHMDIDDGRQKHRMCAELYCDDWFCADGRRREDGE